SLRQPRAQLPARRESAAQHPSAQHGGVKMSRSPQMVGASEWPSAVKGFRHKRQSIVMSDHSTLIVMGCQTGCGLMAAPPKFLRWLRSKFNSSIKEINQNASRTKQ